MATPTRTHAVSTPKPHLSTPNRLMASPRPGAATNTGRPFAHKSPAVKTPASNHGHTHHVSVSSQPSSTPLTTTAIHDDLLNLTSPAAALMASLGPTGMTPLGTGADGLGISSNGHDQAVRGGIPPVSAEVERFQRAEWIANLLKSRVAGRGITREGVERIAQLQGFNTLWDDDNLTIAGNAVDLELNFESLNRDVVKDVSLKLSNSEHEEPQLQENGTKVLKQNLSWPLSGDHSLPWASLSSFESNLHYLRQVDQIEDGASCFNVINTLSHSFKQIWDAEKQKLNWHHHLSHIRRGAIGKPFRDRGARLGLSLDYWVRKEQLGASSTDDEIVMKPDDLYTIQISCESDPNPTLLPRNWLSEQVLSEQPQAASILEADGDLLMPEWQDPSSDGNGSNDLSRSDQGNTTGDKSAPSLPSMVNMHFVCSLSPQVYLPLNAAAGLSLGFPMLDLNQESTVTYQKALHDHFNKGKPNVHDEVAEERWSRDLFFATGESGNGNRRHSYALHSAQNAAPLWCFPVTSLNFTHPRQLAAALPVLRQYALLGNILQSLVEFPSSGDADQKGKSSFGEPREMSPVHRRTVKRSNVKSGSQTLPILTQRNGHSLDREALPIDISLDVISDPSRARLDLFIPLKGTLHKKRRKPFIYLSLEVCSGGSIEVRSLQGVQASDSDDTLLKQRVARVLATTEDIGIVVEWLIGQAFPQD
ncbi:hypothetical protein LTR84_011666 [Exophiala bonariae]|uniref:Mediator of RNA polymerase II transcription subunit 1 n=1 Tax=Exophiala bonariae TaxID=1690606 RepID=A0AAV9NI52_9EURO|nr:hypothetical protein LTR84_011666 [Exophiala bonariae]